MNARLEVIDHRHIAAPVLIEAGPEPGSKEWLIARRKGIGGSDAAASIDMSPWMSAFELFLDKRNERLPSIEENVEPKRWGQILEPAIRDEYGRRTGLVVERVPMLRSVTHPFMLANLDGIVRETGAHALTPSGRIVEIKTARTAEGWGEDGSDAVPLHYQLQCQHYMHVTGFQTTDVAVLIGGCDFRVLHVLADPELQEMLVAAEAEFWNRVLHNDPPPPRDLNDVRLRWGHLASRAGALIASPDEVLAVSMLREKNALIKEIETSRDQLKMVLMQRLGEAGSDSLLDADDGRLLLTWKLGNGPTGFDKDQFALDHPELFQKYVRPGKPTRRFLVK
jgi:putative phage-type endonuclease